MRPILVLCLAAVLLLPQLHRGGLSGYDDALYAHEAKEMVDHGDWWNIHYNGGLNFEYPPMFIWLDAVSLRWLGGSDFAAKLPSALAGIGTVGALYLLAVELTGSAWVAILAMLVLATTQPFLKYSTHAMTDVPFTFFLTLALLFYLKGLHKQRYLLCAGAAIAAAILTRSVMGVLPLGIISLDLILNRRWQVLRSPHATGGLLIAIAIPTIWAGSQYHLHGPEFLSRHFSFIAEKVQAPGSHVPAFQVWPYLKELLKYYWPWLPVFVASLFMSGQKHKSFGLLWAAIVIFPLIFIQTTYGRYLMPAFPGMALICAMALDRWIPPARRDVFFRAACVVVLGAAAYTILAPSLERGIDMRVLAPAVTTSTQPDQRVFLYTSGERRFDIQNQLLWYTSRYADLVTELPELQQRLQPGTVGIMDKPSFATLKPASEAVQVLAESEGFVCYRVSAGVSKASR